MSIFLIAVFDFSAPAAPRNIVSLAVVGVNLIIWWPMARFGVVVSLQ
jgi:hypothetical protein